MRVPVRAGGSGRGMIWWCVHACACEGRRKWEGYDMVVCSCMCL